MPASPEPRATSPRIPSAAELPERERRILEFERRTWRHAGAKEGAIADTFGVSSTRYHQLLDATIDTPAALRYDPILVGRLLRARDARLARRASRRLAPPSSVDGPTL
ncbi:DUF3263 domain-containing protein [Galbitalea sp. SE-J8]|uniref:DUF3263 domain-containing protein n=1 Tax=Galbitalea sp. SE-J8 TaxID=3054952 RepID=UPI00259CB9F7|nr:DUF3263 domain-containing protein [Galbitalea sp. SE-J8]MDM4763744.1 DUF3263 domain-containing protein [Galbitalea sp. SE-J8]